jgi:hypothetical protein
VSTTSIEFVANLRGDAHAAANRLARTLKDIPSPGLTTPRLAGEIRYPKIVLWRSRGFGATLARFDGVIQEHGSGAVLVGRVSASEVASLLVYSVLVPSIVFFVVVVSSAFRAGWVAFLEVSAIFAALLWTYIYLARRFVKSGSSADAQLLIQDMREFLQESASDDS